MGGFMLTPKTLRPVIWLLLLLTLGFSSCKSDETDSIGQAGSDGGLLTPQSGDITTTNPPASGGGTDTGTIPGDPGPGGGDTGYVDLRSAAQLVISPATFDFQVQSVNSLNYATFTLTNTGTLSTNKPATQITGVGLSGAYSFRQGQFPGLNGTCTQTLEAGSSCTIVIMFSPPSVGQFPLDSFRIAYDTGDATAEIPVSLSGTATNIATLQFTDQVDDNNYYNFGNLAYGVSVTEDIHVEYWGVYPATGVTFSGLSAPFSIVSNTCGQQVTQGCDVLVGYTGTAVGQFQQVLKVTY